MLLSNLDAIILNLQMKQNYIDAPKEIQNILDMDKKQIREQHAECCIYLLSRKRNTCDRPSTQNEQWLSLGTGFHEEAFVRVGLKKNFFLLQ